MTYRNALAQIFCIGLAAAVACGGETSSAGFALRDSAGIVIAESGAPLYDDASGWQLSPGPALEIGQLEGEPEYQLYRVRGAVRFPDGRIAVANAGTNEIRFYDEAGIHLSTSGREGEGPGEFRNIGLLARMGGDSLLVWDGGNARVSILDGRGAFVRSFRLDTGTDEQNVFPQVQGLLDDRILLARSSLINPDPQTGVSRDSAVYRSYDLDGAPLDSVGRFPGTEFFIQTVGQGGIAVSPLPFGRAPQLAFDGTGFYFGSGDRYEIGHYAADGTLLRLVRKLEVNPPVTAEDIEAAKREQLDGASERWRERLEEMFRLMTFPETFPAHASLLADSEGYLWVSDYPRPDATDVSWSVFDPEGRWLLDVVMPADFTPTQIGRDFVLGSYRDELGVESVRLYALNRTE